MARPDRQPASGAGLAGDALVALSLLGGGLPEEAERQLRTAGLMYDLQAAAEAHLRAAQALAPDHPAVRIGLYRFYFYKGRLVDALRVALACLLKPPRESGLNADGREVDPPDAPVEAWGEALPGVFLFTLKAWAHLKLRLGESEAERTAVEKLLDLHSSDDIGARALLGVLDRMDRNEGDER